MSSILKGTVYTIRKWLNNLHEPQFRYALNNVLLFHFCKILHQKWTLQSQPLVFFISRIPWNFRNLFFGNEPLQTCGEGNLILEFLHVSDELLHLHLIPLLLRLTLLILVLHLGIKLALKVVKTSSEVVLRSTVWVVENSQLSQKRILFTMEIWQISTFVNL